MANNRTRLEQMVSEIMAKGDVRPVLNNRNYSNVFADGKYIYSYGPHFIMGAYIGNTWLVNSDRYSTSTGRQLSYLRDALRKNGIPDSRIIFAPMEGKQSTVGDLLRHAVRACDGEIANYTKQLEKTRNGSGNNLRIKGLITDYEESLKRLVVLKEMQVNG